MSSPITYTFIAANTSYVCLNQTTAGVASLVINGAGWDGYDNPRRIRLTTGSPGFERTISLTSTGNLSAVNFTVTGTDIRGATITETRVGPNNNTVYTTKFFYSVTSITVDAAVGTNVSVGIGTTGRSQWYKTNYQITPFNIGFGVTVSNTDLTWTIVQTEQDVEASEPAANSILNNDDPDFVTQTTSRQGNYMFPVNAFRLNIVSSTVGTAVMNIYQAGIT